MMSQNESENQREQERHFPWQRVVTIFKFCADTVGNIIGTCDGEEKCVIIVRHYISRRKHARRV